MNINNNSSNKLKRDYSQVEGEKESPPPKYPKLHSVVEKLAISPDNSPESLKNRVSENSAQPEIEKVAYDSLEIQPGASEEVKDPVNETQLPFWSLIPIELKTILLSNLDFMDLLKIRSVSQEFKAILDREIIERVSREKTSLDGDSNIFVYLKKIIEHHGVHLKYLRLTNEASFDINDFCKIVHSCPNLEEIDISFGNSYAQLKVAATIRVLAQKNRLLHLKTLSIACKNERAIQYLTDVPLSQLTTLRIHSGNFNKFLEGICKSTHFSNLNHLSLKGGELNFASLEKLHGAPFRLSSLNLSGTKIGEQELKVLKDLATRSKWNLSEISLSHCSLGDENMPHLADLLKSLNITSLNLVGNSLTKEGIKEIAPYISSLSSLRLSANKIGIEGLELVLNAKPKLTKLYMVGTEIGDEGAQMIFNFENFKFIHTLDLQDNSLSSEFFSSLEKKHIESNLECLFIGSNNIQNSDAEKIAQLSPFSKLKYLDIGFTGISPAGGIIILKALPQLKEMCINNDETDGTIDGSVDETVESELDKLAKSRGCKIHYTD